MHRTEFIAVDVRLVAKNGGLKGEDELERVEVYPNEGFRSYITPDRFLYRSPPALRSVCSFP